MIFRKKRTVVKTTVDEYIDLTGFEKEVIGNCFPKTMTGQDRLIALIRAIEYLCSAGIDGSIVECGVWKGGSMMAAAYSLIYNGMTTKELVLYDTFDGMTKPESVDISFDNKKAIEIFEKKVEWCRSALYEVQCNMAKTGYPSNKIKYVKGKVEDTLKEFSPEKIALLRLDTDWYRSTKIELEYLFPLLEKNGVLIIDDFGHWNGARKAVDEYFESNNIKIFLNRVDYTCRLGIKN